MIRTLVAAVATALVTAPVALADPATDTSCTPALAGVMSKKPAADVVMLCKDRMWYPQPADAPPSDRWVSFGPTLTLHGEGLPDPNLVQGSWNAIPLGPWTRCRSVQQTGYAPGAISKPVADQGSPNTPMSFEVEANVVTIQFSGYCLWMRST
jgi:hypothetical protein